MKKYLLLFFQGLVIPYTIILFQLFSGIFNKLDSLILSLLSYWFYIIIVSLIFAIKDNTLSEKLKSIFGKSNSLLISLICFIPVIGVLIVAFLPIIPNIRLSLLIVGILLGLMNGILEEIFWRGFILAKFKENFIIISIISVILFSANHSAFLFLKFNYQGGATNLIGGPLIMGALWLFVAKKTSTIKYGIYAHQLVNILAFTSMFVLNIS
ncbi:MAG: hypothetical protein A2086_11095 [Spirochaetes bacterium GWD1_27_9]|nr:MAG: hypothetical protein A2Z98_03240 [Spirochaetes bacterium GWB1_27_13]OHD26374.1 MAG: hypothetical protein A2Y34_05765 [Spirochaetes bacterium GWC1_27_15]OHD42114.1 MAG: hypothetical protein A2086_11095 [Spirochaetes bacterium GWD1_27_9]